MDILHGNSLVILPLVGQPQPHLTHANTGYKSKIIKCSLTPNKKSSTKSNIPFTTTGPFRDIHYINRGSSANNQLFVSLTSLNFFNLKTEIGEFENKILNDIHRKSSTFSFLKKMIKSSRAF